MSRASFGQADLQRIFRAAKAVGAIVQIDLKTLAVTVVPESSNVLIDRRASERLKSAKKKADLQTQ